MEFVGNNETITISALKELLEATKICLNTVKIREHWGHEGVLGFPAAILLTCFVDAVGFILLENNDSNKVNDSLKILKDKGYFPSPLTGKEYKFFYNHFRTDTLHRATLRYGTGIKNEPNLPDKIILVGTLENGETVQYLNLHALQAACLNLFTSHLGEIKSRIPG